MNKPFKLYPILLTILISTQILCFIYARRQVDIFSLPVNVSGIIFPIDLYLFEIIGECYGYEYARQAVWINCLTHLIFLTFSIIIASLPFSEFMHADLVYSYKHLLNISWLVIFGSLIGTFLGDGPLRNEMRQFVA